MYNLMLALYYFGHFVTEYCRMYSNFKGKLKGQ